MFPDFLMLFQLETLVIFGFEPAHQRWKSIKSQCLSTTWICIHGCFWFPLKVASVIYKSPQLARNISGILISGIFFSIGWLYITDPTYLGEPETTIDCTMVNCHVFSTIWENMVLLSLEEAPPFLPAKQIHFLLAMPWWELWLFCYVPARPKAKTCWVKGFSLWFLPFTHPPPCWKYKTECHKIAASKYLPNFHWGVFVKFSDIKRPQVMRPPHLSNCQ